MIASIDIFEVLRGKLGDTEAKILVKEMEKIDASVDIKIDHKFDEAKSILSTKEDIANLRGELKTEIANSKADLIKWMVALILGLFIALIGSMAALIKLIH